MGGLLAKADSSLPFLVASAVGLVNACVWMAVGKETLVAQKPFSWARVSPVLALRHLLTRNKVVTWLSGALLFSVLALSFVPVFVLYAEERFQWGELTIGLTIACFGLLVILTQGFLMKPVVGEWGAEKAIHYSSLAMVGLCLGLGVAWYVCCSV
jgi:DHA1 family tetracycline resistance protein-like MFS transporter